jgi:uncharacterized C2H2 Zn-finger protein
MIEQLKGMVVRDDPERRLFRCTECSEVFAEEPWPRYLADHPQECPMCGVVDDDDDDDGEYGDDGNQP